MAATQIGFIGAGRMATALARGLVNAEIFAPEAIVASDPHEAARSAFQSVVPGVHVRQQNIDVAQSADVLLLAVKPQQMGEVLGEIESAVRPGALVISIAAGITLEYLAAGLPQQQPTVRVMPNTPCLIARGASCYSLGPHATADQGELVKTLLSSVGAAFEVPEPMLDAVTGLSGSGPAFVYSMIEAMALGGEKAGLPVELAAELAVRTVLGAAEMVQQTRKQPADLREQVTSPGGTTQAGLEVLSERGFSEAIVAAISAATRRSKELGRSHPRG